MKGFESRNNINFQNQQKPTHKLKKLMKTISDTVIRFGF
jgi:hypothetical protein